MKRMCACFVVCGLVSFFLAACNSGGENKKTEEKKTANWWEQESHLKGSYVYVVGSKEIMGDLSSAVDSARLDALVKAGQYISQTSKEVYSIFVSKVKESIPGKEVSSYKFFKGMVRGAQVSKQKIDRKNRMVYLQVKIPVKGIYGKIEEVLVIQIFRDKVVLTKTSEKKEAKEILDKVIEEQKQKK